MRNRLRTSLLGLLLLLSACARSAPPPAAEPPSAAPPARKENVMPFTLSVIQEFNDGKRLYIKAAIDAQTRWSTSDIAVKLTGFRNGEPAGEKFASLDSLGPVLQAGERREIPIVLESADVTEYQLELLWGADRAATIPNVSEDRGAQKGLTLRNITIGTERVNCHEQNDCELKFTISGELFNGSEAGIDYAVLGTGFLWAEGGKLDLSAGIPENESRIELSGLSLGPGATRRVRLVLDQTVPERSDGAYKPVLRVISSGAGTPAVESGPAQP